MKSSSCTLPDNKMETGRNAECGGSRKSFQRQPARAVLVDFSPTLDNVSCHNIYEAFSNLLTLTNHLQGPSRVPLLSIFALGNFPECLFPLQPVCGNFPRVMIAMNELRVLSKTIKMIGPHVRDCILDGLKEALAQFSRLLQGSKQNASVLPSQIEITLITARSESYIRTFVEKFACQLDLQHLRKVNAVIVSNPDCLMEHSTEGTGSGEVLWDNRHDGLMTESISDLGMSILDLTLVDCDTLSLQNVFHSWLHDCSTDQEHLHLVLPLPHTSSPRCQAGEDYCYGEGEEEEEESGLLEGGTARCNTVGASVPHTGGVVMLKCDFQERILNPSTCFNSKLGNSFSLHVSQPTCVAASSGRGSPPLLPTYRLRVIATLPASGVCESVVFGVPLVLRPTSCWKLEWEELESNQHYFHAICKLLSDKDLVLLACAEIKTSPSCSPHFILLPSPATSTFLVKSIAPRELVLPTDLVAPEEQPALTAMKKMEGSLNMLEHWSSYNPLLVQSGFLEVLASMVKPQSKRGSSSLSLHGHLQPEKVQVGVQKSGLPSSKRVSGRGRGGSGLLPSNRGRSLGTKRPNYHKSYLEMKQK